ncbi:hypothetical protein [Streptomyces goshikiensis]
MAKPHSPAQWHGHPFVWAWYVSIASLDATFIENRCQEAKADEAPADAVYKTGPRSTPPNKWITLEQLSEDHRDRVRDYGNALLRWEQELTVCRSRPALQLPPTQHPTATPTVPAPGDPSQY